MLRCELSPKRATCTFSLSREVTAASEHWNPIRKATSPVSNPKCPHGNVGRSSSLSFGQCKGFVHAKPAEFFAMEQDDSKLQAPNTTQDSSEDKSAHNGPMGCCLMQYRALCHASCADSFRVRGTHSNNGRCKDECNCRERRIVQGDIH